MQAIVGGYIEAIPIQTLERMGIRTYCNEDGISLDLPENRGFLGTLLVVREDGEHIADLTDEDVAMLRDFDFRGEYQKGW